MCWSGEASSVLAAFGLCATVHLAKKGESRELWMPLGYFALMELLQAVTYLYINQCDLLINKILTTLGYVHIMFQPFFVNMVAMYFIPEYIKNSIANYVYIICGIGVMLFIIKLYPFTGTTLCHFGEEPFCGSIACSLRGEWHIAWQLPLNNLLSDIYVFKGLHSYTYLFVSFIMPIFYGSWRLVLVTFFLGPFIAFFSTHNMNEFPAIWCLFSIALCLTIIKSPIRKYLHNESWFLYPLFYRNKWLDISYRSSQDVDH